MSAKTIICWDNLDGFVLSPNGNLINRDKTKSNFWYFKECFNCGKEFLGRRKETKFCSLSCSSSGIFNVLYGKKSPGMSGKKHNAKTKIKMSKAQSGEKNHFFGKKHTEEAKRKITENHGTNRQEVRDKISKTLGDGRLAGDKNPSWRGGISHDGYCFLWRDSEFKELIKDRDGHTCIRCGATKDLIIHHIDYNKLNCKASNLATLCRSCNSKANFKRKEWCLFYTKLLIKLYKGKLMPKRITVQSAKAKGRRLQQWVSKQISKLLNIPVEKDGDIESRPMGQSGTDVILRGKAQKMFPFSVECKYQETWSVPAFIRQAKENRKSGTNWLLFVKKNQHEEIVILDANVFFSLLPKHNKNKSKSCSSPGTSYSSTGRQKLIKKKKPILIRKKK